MLFFGISLKVLAAIASVVVVGGSTTAILVTQLKEAEKPAANIFNTLVRDPLIEKIKNKSIEEIKTWQPTDEEKIVIATNFSSIIKHVPNEFFTRLQDEVFIKLQGVGYIKAHYDHSATTTAFFIPFLQSELKSEIKPVNGRAIVIGQANGEVEVGTYIPSKITDNGVRTESVMNFQSFLSSAVDHKNNKARLKSIMNGESTPKLRLPYGTYPTSETTKKEKVIATDLFFLQKLYDDTIARFIELGNKTNHRKYSSIWVADLNT